MNYRHTLAIFLFLSFSLLTHSAHANSYDSKQPSMFATADSVIHAQISKHKFVGNVSFALSVSKSEKERFSATFHHFNVVVHDVEQELLARVNRESSSQSSVGFRLVESQAIELDEKNRSLVGKLMGVVDYQYQSILYPSEMESKESLQTPPPAQTAIVRVEIPLSSAVFEILSNMESQDEIVVVPQSLKMSLNAMALEKYQGFTIELEGEKLDTSWGYSRNYTFGKKLCLQPINISGADPSTFPEEFRFLFQRFFSPSGRGYAFGMPYAKEMWGQVGVTFDIRDWITLDDERYVVTTPWETNGTGSDPTAHLYNEVNISDCIEIFFIHTFEPIEWWGGGASTGVGHSGVKIITSDANVNGIDYHHIAHELGHVLGLLHPDTAPIQGYPQSSASSGTLMCPSGFRNDNPGKNSVENGRNVQNPLLRFSLIPIFDQPACQNGQDCGECPPVPY